MPALAPTKQRAPPSSSGEKIADVEIAVPMIAAQRHTLAA
jgi:hypothetical protein